MDKNNRNMLKKTLVVLLCILFITLNFFIILPNNFHIVRSEKIENYIPTEVSKKNYNENKIGRANNLLKEQLSFAAFADTHIGARYQYPITGLTGMADYLDKLGEDLSDSTNLLDFAVHLGDIANHNTAQVNGVGLPWYVNQYKNCLKDFLISHVNIPYHFVIGNHDVNDYEMNKDDPHNLTKSLINEISMNNPVYAMMRDGILFLVVPELGYITWTHPVLYEWVEFMTGNYPDSTTIILSHQAIEDTTKEESHIPYRGKQDMDWWPSLFQNNSQIKMWIHGHNHYLDWYIGNQSTGETQDFIWEFGHEMAFSSPYAQADWYNNFEEDRIVIYNISSTGITTASWENNGKGGHWISDYSHSWNVPTTYDSNAADWYSFPMFLQDNETQLTDMKLLSPNITLQLIGTVPMELFYDEKMESPDGHSNEIILGFGNDRNGNVNWTNPGMKVFGPTYITFPEKYTYYESDTQEDGRSGPPYKSFPMGTICAAVPGQTYNFTITARCDSGSGRFKMMVNCSDWGTKSQYSILSGSETQVFSHTFGFEYETIYGTYTVPDNDNAWFLQGNLDFLDSTDYEVSLFSVKRERISDVTKDFHMCLSGKWFNVSGNLEENELASFSIDPQFLSDVNGVMNFTAFIDGNRYGMVNLIYHEPLLLSRNARFRINSYIDGVFNLSLTKKISQNSIIKEILWNSPFFKKVPILTELFSRILVMNISGSLLYLIFERLILKNPGTFKMFPYSTDSVYNQIEINTSDGTGVKHVTNNGNIWLSCDISKSENVYIKVLLPE